MIQEKHLTIREVKNEIKKLENELDIYATKKNINFLKTQPKAAQIKDIIVDSSHINFDSFFTYVSRDEECDSKIYGLLASIYSYKMYIAKELQRMSKYDEIGYIKYLKDEENKSWKEIDKMLHHADGYSKLKLQRFYKKAQRNKEKISRQV
jgi:hypothetical protein